MTVKAIEEDVIDVWQEGERGSDLVSDPLYFDDWTSTLNA
jgi:hypothetical protein